MNGAPFHAHGSKFGSDWTSDSPFTRQILGHSNVNPPRLGLLDFDSPPNKDDFTFVAYTLAMVCDDDPSPVTHPLNLNPSILVDVIISSSLVGLNPTKHSTVLFKLDQGIFEEGVLANNSSIRSKKVKGSNYLRVSQAPMVALRSSKTLKLPKDLVVNLKLGIIIDSY